MTDRFILVTDIKDNTPINALLDLPDTFPAIYDHETDKFAPFITEARATEDFNELTDGVLPIENLAWIEGDFFRSIYDVTTATY